MTDIVERLRHHIAIRGGPAKDDDGKYIGTTWPMMLEAADEIERLRGDAADLQATFDLQWEADMRAVKRWREAHPGNDLVLPDRANMVVWLLEQHDAHAQCALDSETIQTLLDLLNPLHGETDRQLPEQFTDEREWDAPDDREYNINITARMERDLTQAVLILENRRSAVSSTECGDGK